MRVRVLPFERLLLASDLVAVGSHRLPADHPQFESYGPTSAFLLVFPRSSTIIEHSSGERFIGSPAVASLYNRGQEYRRKSIGGQGDDCEWFAIAPAALREVVTRFDPAAAESDRPLRFTHVRVEPRLYLRQRAVVDRLTRAGRGDTLQIEEMMLSVLSELLARAYAVRSRRPDGRSAGSQEELARAADVLLSRTFRHNWSLSRIAGELGSSPFHLARSFRRATGSTIHQHRMALRLHASLAMLRDTGEDIGGLALDLGFSDHSHFTAAFRQHFGVTPSVYRNRARFS